MFELLNKFSFWLKASYSYDKINLSTPELQVSNYFIKNQTASFVTRKYSFESASMTNILKQLKWETEVKLEKQ